MNLKSNDLGSKPFLWSCRESIPFNRWKHKQLIFCIAYQLAVQVIQMESGKYCFHKLRNAQLHPLIETETKKQMKIIEPHHKSRKSFNSSLLCAEKGLKFFMLISKSISFCLIDLFLSYSLELADAPKSSQCGFFFIKNCGFWFYLFLFIFSAIAEKVSGGKNMLDSSFNFQRIEIRYFRQIKQKSATDLKLKTGNKIMLPSFSHSIWMANT